MNGKNRATVTLDRKMKSGTPQEDGGPVSGNQGEKMSADEIYEIMSESDQRRVILITDDGERLSGYVDVFESRLDNEDDEEDVSGLGSIGFHSDNGKHMLLYECHIKSIKIMEGEGIVHG